MNEKIKEIEQYLKKCNNCFTCNNFLGEDENGGHCMLQNAYNHITNLQEENNLLKAKIKCMEEKINYKTAYKDESEIYNEFFK